MCCEINLTAKSNSENVGQNDDVRSSSFSEAINRKINVIIGMAYGYHCLEYLKLKILQRCGPIGRYWKAEIIEAVT